MNILMNILADSRTAIGNNYVGLPFNEVDIVVRQGTKVILSGNLDTLTPVGFTIARPINLDSGIATSISFNKGPDFAGGIGSVSLDLSIPRMTDSVTFTVELRHASYFTYSNTFTVFGYDLGNTVNFNTADGRFTGIPNGDVMALENNSYNPIFEISLGSDSPIYGDDDDADTAIVRHNSDFNIGMIPLTIEETVGVDIPQDFRYGTSGRFVSIKNPVDNNVRVVNANSNQPGMPAYVITYGYKEIVNPSYTYTTLAEFSHIMTDGDWDIVKLFSIGTGTPVEQRRYHVRDVNIIPNNVKKINGQAMSSFTGELNGNVHVSVEIDEHSVFYFWANNERGLSGIGSVMLVYTLEEVLSGPIYTPIARETKLAQFYDADSLYNATANIPYSEVANGKNLSSINDNILVRVSIDTIWVGMEDAASKRSGLDTLNDGNHYMIASKGVNNEENYIPIGYSGGGNPIFDTFQAINTATWNFSADGALYELLVITVQPLALYAPILNTTFNRYAYNTDLVYTDVLPTGFSIDGYIKVLPIAESRESITLPYSNIYSIITSGCGSFDVTTYPGGIGRSLLVTILIWDDETSSFIFHSEEIVQVSINESITETISLPDGIYVIIIGSDTYNYFSSCSIMECYMNVVKGAVCSCCEHDDCKAKAYYRFNEFMLLWNTYLAMISVNIEDFNFIDSNLIDYAKYLDYIEISKLQARLIDLCDDCKSITKKCNNC